MSPPRPAARLTVPDASSLALEGRRRRGLLPVLFCGGRPRVPLPILTGRPRPSGSRDPGSQSHAGPRQVPGGWGVRVIAAQASSPPGPPFQPLGRRRAGSKTGSWGPSELPAEAACEPPALTRHARSGCVTPREPPVFTRLSPSDSWAFLTGPGVHPGDPRNEPVPAYPGPQRLASKGGDGRDERPLLSACRAPRNVNSPSENEGRGTEGVDVVNRVSAGLAATALVVTRQPGLLGSLSVTQRQVSSLLSHQEPREGPVDASRGLRVHPPRLGPEAPFVRLPGECPSATLHPERLSPPAHRVVRGSGEPEPGSWGAGERIAGCPFPQLFEL
ncbi:uncharacterized protein LOC102902091 isoform X1 [Felis catus]|uniref:uncharacterized protein LOC102902091 isoform X1 n=1 Tax=Felis catus TaxID=9685 RepID=UPI001D1A3235|nr:uncharacterized protein LOC102902091 isoform X1 [Felis catus]